MPAPSKPALLIPARAPNGGKVAKALPALLQSSARGEDAARDPFLANVSVEEVYPLASPGRGEPTEPTLIKEEDMLLALEAIDGSTVFMRADRLREELARLYPESVKEGQVDLAGFRDREAATRGAVDWIWSKVTTLVLGPDGILDAAKGQALKWAEEWLGEKAQEAMEWGASWLGAKALMWAIESRLPGQPGLYQWNERELNASDRRERDDPRLTRAAEEGPMLVFIHGTASHTLGSFKDLREPARATDWAPLEKRFGNRVFGFEHRTFSESPIDNALALAEAVPAKARLSFVTHSRGGLVGDLLCLGSVDEALFRAYRREAPVNREESEWERRVREKVAEEEQQKLKRLLRLLNEKEFTIERYVRVACPARGTSLLSDNLDVFLSGLLSLTSKLVGAVAGPAAGAVLSAFKRIVLEIADKRIEPQVVPGIEAMLTDAPMGVLLARAPRRQGIQMAVIAGDIEGGNLLKRIGVMFTDWMFFDRVDNDLVVDTSSMYAGLARPGETSYLYDQGANVNHFSYFDNRITRRALRDWLTVDTPATLSPFNLLERESEPTPVQAHERAIARRASRGEAEADTRPVVILLPGIMGSHLERRRANQPRGAGNRVWFDPFDLAMGGLGRIRYGEPTVHEESLFRMFYGDLTEFLGATHTVIPFPYDWRRPIQETAELLAKVTRYALENHPRQPVRLLAHSMGGLVARTMIARHKDTLWNEIFQRPGARFIMLGTPNHGSHLMVETLLGKSGTVRMLARLDLRHNMAEVLEILAGFPGALQLLPRPGFMDTGQDQPEDYFDRSKWEQYRPRNKDRWFGDGQVGVPHAASLATARALWEEDLRDAGDGMPKPEHVAYVFGQAELTPCGLRIEAGRLKLVGTPEGDGSVTWASGKLAWLPPERWWHMPAPHGNLADTAEHFPAILDLLQSGETNRLGRLPASRGVAPTRAYDAGPVPFPTEEEVTRSLLGARPRQRKRGASRQQLSVRVVAMDLRNVQVPVLCGHYLGDPIAGAEAQLDQHVVGRALSQRERLGIYAGEIGTTAVVLATRCPEDIRRGTGRGAVIIGLGRMGELSVGKISETVRTGVLRLLLQASDRQREEESLPCVEPSGEIRLASLLIGYNSTANISIEDSVAAIVRGVCEANQQFDEGQGSKLRVGRLDFVELFRDSAITAAHAVRELPKRLEHDLRRWSVTIDPEDLLTEKDGVRERLSVLSAAGYWPRLIVTDADRPEEACPPECYRVRRVSPIPDEVLDDLVDEELRRRGLLAGGQAGANAASKEQFPHGKPARALLAERLKYVHLSVRARSEVELLQRQPGLIEAMVQASINQSQYNPSLAQSLFHLMVPLDLKETVRHAERLVLVVDGYTANLPWEMLQPDDQPLVGRTRLVRQFLTTRFRRTLLPSTNRTACVIVDPSTEGFVEHFGKPDQAKLPPLPAAVQEGEAVREILGQAHYDVEYVPSETRAADVIGRLFKRPYRILVIAAHGAFELTARDRSTRSGVILSDGTVLTAAEVCQMEVVPDLVFLNCCHLGKTDSAPGYNKLAYSLARELIEMGVRCVVAAGWRVDDEAARTFATTFFRAFITEGQPFGEAIHGARQETYRRHAHTNTWGAYQAYGEPGFRLEAQAQNGDSAPEPPMAPDETVAALDRLRTETCQSDGLAFKEAKRRVAQVLGVAPADWQDLPEIQSAIGSLYAEYGQEGFELAQAAYHRALTAEDKRGRLPVKVIEQLANLEARTGEAVGGEKGVERIDRSIERLTQLLACTDDPAFLASEPRVAIAGPVGPANAERWCLLGSAWKRKGGLLARQGGARWKEVSEALSESHAAYHKAGDAAEDQAKHPYSTLNRLQLDGLLGEVDSDTRPQLVELAKRCAEVARRRFGDSYDFFDAVMVADADLAIWMIQGKTGGASDLSQAYRDAVAQVPRSDRQFDSVARQLELLARFYRLRGEEHDSGRAEVLTQVAASLGSSANAPAPQQAAPGRSARKKPRRGR